MMCWRLLFRVLSIVFVSPLPPTNVEIDEHQHEEHVSHISEAVSLLNFSP